MANNVKEHVINNQKVVFKHYSDGALWYETELGLLFPVPVSDIGTATFMAEDKAMLFMRYIRKHLAELEKAKEE